MPAPVTRVIPLATNVNSTIKNYLAQSAISVNDWVELNSSGSVQRASQTSGNRIVGMALAAAVAGSVQTIPVQTGGVVTASGWNFPNIGQPVYGGQFPGLAVQDVSFITEGYVTEIGIALGSNQLQIGIKAPVLVSVSATSALALASKTVFAALATKATLDTNAYPNDGTGELAVFTSPGVLGAVSNLILPTVGGTILTDNSLISGSDYS